MNDIVMICPYFGKLPNTINLTLYTLARNKNVDWILVTDNEIKYKSHNIRIIHCSYDDMKSLIKQKIGVSLSSPYKLCDFKPCYGFLFEELFSNYHYWGYFDIDSIYGKIDDFITEKILQDNQKIYDLGHFSIYRNDSKINRLFIGTSEERVPYAEILGTAGIVVFDEPFCIYKKNGKNYSINEIFKRNGYKVYENRKDFADIDVKHKNFHILHWNEKLDSGRLYFEYNDGMLLLKDYSNEEFKREVIYVHLQKKNLSINSISNLDTFFITPKGFYNENTNVDGRLFYHISVKWVWYIRFRAKRFLKNRITIWKMKSSITNYP
ncbi:DUF6625 family protein [Anaerostipes faecalis]|uniref:DUF6625 family protein n=1 Tax=Anaerostipes faecalis TaxID=2738446 RepID=UPI003F101F8D